MTQVNVKDDEVVAFLVEKLERADASLDPEDLLVAAGARGLQLEPHHVRTAFERLQERWQSRGELNDDALDRVSGGVTTTPFQTFDQKGNQVMNMLTSVIKTIGEMRGIGAGSRSGL